MVLKVGPELKNPTLKVVDYFSFLILRRVYSMQMWYVFLKTQRKVA